MLHAPEIGILGNIFFGVQVWTIAINWKNNKQNALSKLLIKKEFHLNKVNSAISLRVQYKVPNFIPALRKLQGAEHRSLIFSQGQETMDTVAI